ncbi:MAG: hypothetical protein H6582_12440 [Crocinitomicaceae bacterium]|nr:hypothetical protein [Crocinitomicaceae bacterium]
MKFEKTLLAYFLISLYSCQNKAEITAEVTEQHQTILPVIFDDYLRYECDSIYPDQNIIAQLVILRNEPEYPPSSRANPFACGYLNT